MHPQDKALVVLGSISLFIAVLRFFFKRKQGASRAMSVSHGVLAFGATTAAGIFLGVFPFSKHGMGLERFVVPFVVLAAFGVLSIVLGLIVFLFENVRSTATNVLSSEAREILDQLEQRIRRQSQDTPTAAQTDDLHNYPQWKRFAHRMDKQASASLVK